MRNTTHESHDKRDELLDRVEEFALFKPYDPPIASMDELAKRRLITGAVDKVMEERAGARNRHWQPLRRVWILAASVVASIAMTAIMMWKINGNAVEESPVTSSHDATKDSALGELPKLRSEDRSEPDENAIAMHSVYLSKSFDKATGTRIVKRDPIEIGTVIETARDPAFLEAEKRAQYRLEAHSKIRVQETTTSSVVCFLEHGEVFVSVTPQQAGPAIIVATPHGKVRVTGTLFTVRVLAYDTEVKVFKGTVAVERPNATSMNLGAGFAMEMSIGHTRAITEKERRQNISRPAFFVQKPREAPVLSRDRPMSQASKNTTSSALLQSAQYLRKQKQWINASQAYESIGVLYPQSVEADIAPISLGMIQLNHLVQPLAALKNFNHYLSNAPLGTLRHEALYGRIRALRALGKNTAERLAIEVFIKAFPKSLKVDRLENRLAELPTD